MNTKNNIGDTNADLKKVIQFASEDKLRNMDSEELLNVSMCYANELKKSLKEIKRLSYENERLKNKIEDLENQKKPNHKYEGYPINKDYIAKLLFILSKNDTEMTFEDIAAAFLFLENDLHEKWRNPNKSISKIISRAYNFQMITRKKMYGNNGVYVYGLKN
jgi:hypothetical protein